MGDMDVQRQVVRRELKKRCHSRAFDEAGVKKGRGVLKID